MMALHCSLAAERQIAFFARVLSSVGWGIDFGMLTELFLAGEEFWTEGALASHDGGW